MHALSLSQIPHNLQATQQRETTDVSAPTWVNIHVPVLSAGQLATLSYCTDA